MQDPSSLHNVEDFLAGPGPTGPAVAKTLPIQAVSQLLGVPAATLRSWERRYDLPSSARSTGGHRRYSAEQVLLLRRVRDEISAGRPASEAAWLAAASRTGPPAMAEAITRAAHRLDTVGVIDILHHAKTVHGLELTIEQVVLPAMRAIGDQWALGQCDVAHEHLATGAVRDWLSQQSEPPHRSSGSRPVILACGPGESHTIGLEAFAVLLAARGLDLRCLGARTPIPSLLVAIQEVDAAAVVVVAQLGWTRSAAAAALRAVGRRRVARYYAGAAFASVRARIGVEGTYLGDDLAVAADRLRARALAGP